jgi:hypothetical protein
MPSTSGGISGSLARETSTLLSNWGLGVLQITWVDFVGQAELNFKSLAGA